MKKWIKENALLIAGTIAGGIAGYLYWKFIGCESGACIMTSHPVASIAFGGVFGNYLGGIGADLVRRIKMHAERKQSQTGTT